MKAIVHHTYGSPELLELRDVDKPVPKDDEVLVRVHAASVNPADWHLVTGTPYLVRMQAGLRRPKPSTAGIDVAGQVEAVGAGVTRFRPGDDVFGGASGAFAEYACVREARTAKKPANVTYEQAASVPVAALTALQGLRDKGKVEPGSTVLVNGAAGGVGTFAVQLAKSFGAHVTGVCSTGNVDLVRSLGADEVVDYTRQDFTRLGRRYDVILDNVGTRTLADRRRAMSPDGTLVLVSGPKKNRWVGPMGSIAVAVVVSRFGNQRMVPMFTQLTGADLATMAELLSAGTVTPVIDRRYPLDDVPAALTYLGEGHARGKVVITV